MVISYNESNKITITSAELQRNFIKQVKKKIHVQLPAKVISIDHTKQHCNLEILAKEIDDNGNIQSYPILPNVPIQYPIETGIAYVRLPVQVGDTGTVTFFDSDIAQYKVQGVVEYHFNEDYHNLSSGIYTSGFYAEKNVFTLSDVDNTAIEIGTKLGTFIFNVDKDGNLVVTAPTIIANCSEYATINATNVYVSTGTCQIDGNLVVTGSILGNVITSTTSVTAGTNLVGADAVISGKSVNGHVHTNPEGGNTGAF